MWMNGLFDVSIGLVFVYLLFSLLCTTINEMIATFFSLRSSTLGTAIAKLLSEEDDIAGLKDAASVVVASEAMDGESGWRMLAPGELVHVRPDLGMESWIAVPEPPAHLVPLPPGNPNIDT